MKAVTAGEMQRIDRAAIGDVGIPAEVLMGLAGKAVADFVSDTLEEVTRAAVFCGTGNNGGDGFVAAYLLAQRGINVEVFVVGERSKLSPVSAVYLKVCTSAGIVPREIRAGAEIAEAGLAGYDLLIDAIFGTGFRGAAEGAAREAILAINSSGVPVLSVDVPSGLPSDGGAPEGEAVRASYTVTIGLPKISLVTYPGKDFTGAIHVADIGFPERLTVSDELKTELADFEYAAKRLAAERGFDAHKGSVGHLLLVGGFDGMEGAILMSAAAALETGIGLMTLLTTEKSRSIIAGSLPEMITRSIYLPDGKKPDKENNREMETSLRSQLEEFFNEDRRYSAVLLGPGMGRGAVSSIVFRAVMQCAARFGVKRTVIDGDGLYHLAEYISHSKPASDVPAVITPHFQEAARLVQKTLDEIKANRFDAAKALALKTGCVSLLKGPASIASDGERTLINTSGNPALATAGSGDVLAGIIGALLLRGLPPLDAAGTGMYLHGLAADLYVADHGAGVMKATDIVRYIRKALREIVNRH